MSRETMTAPWAALMGVMALIMIIGAGSVPVWGQENSNRETPQTADQTFSSGVGQRVLEIIELEGEERWQEAVEAYGELLDRDRLSLFERASILKIRGRAYYEMERLDLTIADWQNALSLGILTQEDSNALRINTGQLLMAEGDLRGGIVLIEQALDHGTELGVDLAMRLASGYAQLGDYPPGLVYARQVLHLAETPEERHYSLLLFYFQTLEMNVEQLTLIEEMVDLWPGEKRNWATYANLLAQAGREREAFEVNTIMYVNGMLSTGPEILRVAQYYSYYEYPYRGASILERELNAGRVEPTAANFTLLANSWRQAREWERALPVLHRVATMTGAGPDYQKLGEALYQSTNYSEAEAVFEQALTRTDLHRPGDTWNLLGQVRYEQRELISAIAAYEHGLRFEYSRAGAQGWIDFIERTIALENTGKEFGITVEMERCENHVEDIRREWYYRDDRSYDSESRPILPLEQACLTYFDQYGDIRPEFEQM